VDRFFAIVNTAASGGRSAKLGGPALARLREKRLKIDRLPMKKVWLSMAVLVFSGCGEGSQPGVGRPPTIVFASHQALDGSDAVNTNGAENIWVVSADGIVATPLTKDAAQSVFSDDPAWSPDATMVAFVSNRPSVGPQSNLGGDIWVMKADGSSVIALTGEGSVPIGGAGDPNWSPDGRKIAFSDQCCGLSPRLEVAVMNPDGSGKNVLTQVPTTLPLANFIGGAFAARWSPNGSKLIFVSQGALDNSPTLNINLTENIWVMDPDGSGSTALTRVTAKDADCSGAVWSPDGSKLAFVSARAFDGSNSTDANNTSNIWVINADGTAAKPLTKLTAAGAHSEAPAWSPDGSKLAFESTGALDGTDAANATVTMNIWVMNADGTGATPLTKLTGAGASSASPAWSPGGSKLAFESLRNLDGSDLANPANNIWVMNADGSQAIPVTKNTAKGADSTSPKWHP
jgi:Tol biopolymer transport system component